MCFIAIIALVFLTRIQLPDVKGYELEVSSISPFYSGWTPLDVVTSSFYHLLTSPTITPDLLIFMCFVGVGVASYVGFILGLFIAVIERRKKTDFIFMLSFITCLFFGVFTIVVAVLM